MRFFSILLALLVVVSLYLMTFERDAVVAFAQGEDVAAAAPPDEAAPETADSAPQPVGVVALRSTAETIEQAVLVRGRTEAARQVSVQAETSGKVISEPLRKGAFVEAGDTLCQLDPGTREVSLAEAKARLAEAESRPAEAEARLAEAKAALPAARARVTEAEARLNEAQINYNAAKRLAEGGFASDTRVASAEAAIESARAGLETARSQLEGARAAVESAKSGVESARSGIQSAKAAVAAAEKEIERLTITAPFDGLLESDTAELGTLMQPGTLCATIIQLDPIKLVGFVPETEVEKVEVGATAGARLSSGSRVQGRVTFLSRAADPNTRTFRVEVEVPNDDLAIRDGQTVEIVIRSDGRSAHLIPQSALTLDDEGRLGVRVVGADDRAAFRAVSVLRDSTEGVYVAGLGETADIIVVGQEYVSDGVPVRPTYREAPQ